MLLLRRLYSNPCRVVGIATNSACEGNSSNALSMKLLVFGLRQTENRNVQYWFYQQLFKAFRVCLILAMKGTMKNP
jgi:hypothetical protein